MTDRRGSLGRRGSAAALAALAAVAAALIAPPGAIAKGKTIADNGFRPATNGYSFANYGGEFGYRDLTVAQMRELFGDSVCATLVGGQCVLLPAAQSWMDSVNGQMSGGHCFGFASTSQFWFEGLGRPPTPAPFGAPTTPGLRIAGNPALQSHIAYAFVFQALPRVREGVVGGAPRKVLKALREGLPQGEAPYLVAIMDQGGGHAVTPYAIRRIRKGLFRIWIYDNNHPGERRAIKVNTRRQKWSYDLAEGLRWSGDEETKTLLLFQPALGLGHQPCFFCGTAESTARRGVEAAPRAKMELHWQGDPRTGRHGALFIEDRRGERTGCGPKGCVNRVPGVKVWETFTAATGTAARVKPWTLSPPPIFRLPTGRQYEVSLRGAPLRKPASEGTELIGNGFTLGASGIELRKGERDRLLVGRTGQRIVFDNDRRHTESPLIDMSTAADDASYEFEIQAHRVRRGAEIGFQIKPERRQLLVIPHDRSGRGSFAITVTRITDDGRDAFEDTVEVPSDEPVVFDYGALP